MRTEGAVTHGVVREPIIRDSVDNKQNVVGNLQFSEIKDNIMRGQIELVRRDNNEKKNVQIY